MHSLSKGSPDLFGRIISPHAKIDQTASIGAHVVIEEDCIIGPDVMIGHGVIIRPGTSIGARSKVSHLTVIEGDTIIGEDVCIHGQCHITRGMVIEDKVFVAPFCIFANDKKMAWQRGDWKIEAPILKRGCRLAIACSVAPGVIIGENAVVGVGSVVTKDIPPHEIWYGAPAKFHGISNSEEWL